MTVVQILLFQTAQGITYNLEIVLAIGKPQICTVVNDNVKLGLPYKILT